MAGEREAGCHTDHTHARRQRQRQHGVGGFQRGLGERVAEEIGVHVPELLVQQIHHGAFCPARLQVRVQGLRQQHGRAGVGAQVLLHGGKAEAAGVVVLEGGGAVDHGVHLTEVRGHRGQQGAHAGLVAEVGKEGLGTARAAVDRLAFGGGLLRFSSRVAVVHRHVPARLRQRQRDFAAQALARASDEHGAGGGAGRRGGAGHEGQSGGCGPPWQQNPRV